MEFTLEMCAAAQNHEKFYFGGSRSFKGTDVYTAKKLETSAC